MLLSEPDDSPLIAALHALLNPSTVDEHLVCAGADAIDALGDGPRTFLLHVRFNEDLPKIEDLARYLWEQCFYYALPRRRQLALKKEAEKDPSAMLRVGKAARDAFIAFNEKNPSRASEVAEVLAYCVVQHYLDASQVVAKMGLKTSSNMPVHGLDGVHAKYENGALTIYFLEAKLAKSANGGAKDYAESASNFLSNRSQYLREYQIVSELGNLDALEEPERQLALDHFDILGKPKLHRRERYIGVICYSEKKYGDKLAVTDGPIDVHEKHFTAAYAAKHGPHRAAALKHLKNNGATPRKCMVFYIAVPDVNALRKSFYQEMGVPLPVGIEDIAGSDEDEAAEVDQVEAVLSAGLEEAST
ncbi:DUF1837 domain-containing protein [Rhizobium sp. RMa-01]|nr:DUF1837 domain-containing protein [Rhizobium sp. RMa-01]